MGSELTKKPSRAITIVICIPLNARAWLKPSLVKSLFTFGSRLFVLPRKSAVSNEYVSLFPIFASVPSK